VEQLLLSLPPPRGARGPGGALCARLTAS